MKLVFRGHDERYVVEQSLMNLFPGELPVYEPITPGDDSWAVISLEETGDLCRVAVSLCRAASRMGVRRARNTPLPRQSLRTAMACRT